MVVSYPFLSHSYGKGYSVKQHFWVFYRQVLVAIPLNQQYIRTHKIKFSGFNCFIMEVKQKYCVYFALVRGYKSIWW